MKKSIFASIFLHFLLICLLIFSNKNNGEGNTNAGSDSPKSHVSEKEQNRSSDLSTDRGHFLGQENEVFVTQISEQEWGTLKAQRQQYLKRKRQDCGKDAYGGIGIRGTQVGLVWYVDEVGDGTPASRAGIVAGDTLSSAEVLKGEPGTTVFITVQKKDGAINTFMFTRELICYDKGGITSVPND